MTQAELAAAAKVGLSTVRNFENDAYQPMARNLAAIQEALEAAGVEFLEGGADVPAGGAGVRLRLR